MPLLLLKMTIVPFFILLVTLAGRRWGAKVAGTLGGMPVVAGPIVVLLALEQGQQFGSISASTAILSVLPALGFGICYCWVSLRYHWVMTTLIAVMVWWILAYLLLLFPIGIGLAACLAFFGLWLTPYILPKVEPTLTISAKPNDLIWRMLAGAGLTLAITQSALILGERWSGMLAVFPVIGSILAIFTHYTQSAANVSLLYRGMVRGLCSLTAFFVVLAFAWQSLHFWWAVLFAVATAIGIQLLFQVWMWLSVKLQSS